MDGAYAGDSREAVCTAAAGVGGVWGYAGSRDAVVAAVRTGVLSTDFLLSHRGVCVARAACVSGRV